MFHLADARLVLHVRDDFKVSFLAQTLAIPHIDDAFTPCVTPGLCSNQYLYLLQLLRNKGSVSGHGNNCTGLHSGHSLLLPNQGRRRRGVCVSLQLSRRWLVLVVRVKERLCLALQRGPEFLSNIYHHFGITCASNLSTVFNSRQRNIILCC